MEEMESDVVQFRDTHQLARRDEHPQSRPNLMQETKGLIVPIVTDDHLLDVLVAEALRLGSQSQLDSQILQRWVGTEDCSNSPWPRHHFSVEVWGADLLVKKYVKNPQHNASELREKLLREKIKKMRTGSSSSS